VAAFESQITFCSTRDLQETARFYEGLLGLSPVLDQGGCRIYRVAGGAYLGFCGRETAPHPSGVILTFVTDDVDGWFDRLSDQGVLFEKEPAFHPDYRIYHCLFRDPNGYLLEIQRFEDPRWGAQRERRVDRDPGERYGRQ
jgi:catechol 2,3-dioxygenase-like lactoylglutathione lyase family enzyme